MGTVAALPAAMASITLRGPATASPPEMIEWEFREQCQSCVKAFIFLSTLVDAIPFSHFCSDGLIEPVYDARHES